MLQPQWHFILQYLTFSITTVFVRKVLVHLQAPPHAPPLPPPHPNTTSWTMIAFVNTVQAPPGLHLLTTAHLASQAGALPSYHVQEAAAATVFLHPLAAHHKLDLQVSNLQPAAKAQVHIASTSLHNLLHHLMFLLFSFHQAAVSQKVARNAVPQVPVLLFIQHLLALHQTHLLFLQLHVHQAVFPPAQKVVA